MSLIGTILEKIFRRHPVAGAASTHPARAATPPVPTSSPSSPPPPVDIESVMNQMAQSQGVKLNWRTSIVDLMKLLGLDSSLKARQSLARELGYSGDMNDSAKMNLWLHKQVMKKVADNGGRVPEELKH